MIVKGKRKLIDLYCRFLSGFAFKSSDYSSKGVPLVKIGNIQDRTVRVGHSESFVPEELLGPRTEKFLLKDKDVLIAMTGQGSVGRVGRLYLGDQERALLNQRVGKFQCDEKNLNIDYLYYVLTTKEYQDLLFISGAGSGQPNLSPETILNVEIPYVDYGTQVAISEILASLDDKIELNDKINQELEALAQALFKHWFVDFEFPDENGMPYKSSGGEMVENELGDIPKGWTIKLLEELLEVKYGKDHKLIADGTIPVYGSGGIMRFVNQALYKGHSILIPRKGTLNNVMYVSGPFWSVDTMFFSVIKKECFRKYLYHIIKSLDLNSMNVGSAVPSMTTKVLNNLPVVAPPENLLAVFEKIVSSFHELTTSTELENSNLSKLRDSLLPRLISGEISIHENFVEKTV